MISRQTSQKFAFALLSLTAFVVVIPIVLVVGYIVVQGAGAISWEFLTAMPREGMREGGILPAVVGTVVLTFGTAIAAMPIGIGAAIYLAEYARDTWLTRLIRLAIIRSSRKPALDTYSQSPISRIRRQPGITSGMISS